MTIATIPQLQDALRRIGLLDTPFATDEFDQPTLDALRKFQREAGLTRDGQAPAQPDAQTLSALQERADHSSRFILRGWILGPQGPVPELRVRAGDRDINDLRQPLGDPGGAITDRSGKFEILYTADQFAPGDKDTADLMLTLQRGDERITEYRVYRLEPNAWPPRDQPPRRFAPVGARDRLPLSHSAAPASPLTPEELQLGIPARPVEELKIILGNASDGTPSEYERLRDQINPILRDRPPTALDEEKFRDLTFVAREIGQPLQRISEYVDAWKLAGQTTLRPEVLYGLLRDGAPATLAGLPHELPWLLQAKESAWRAKLQESLTLNFISSALLPDLEKALGELRAARARLADLPMDAGRASLSEFLAGAAPLQSADTRLKFLNLFHAHAGPIDEFWSRSVPREMGWSPAEILQIQTTLQLAELTSFNLPLVEQIKRERSPATLEGLTRIDPQEWLRWIQASGLPDDASGAAPADQQQRAADDILRTLQVVYPNRYVAQLPQRTSDPQLRQSQDLLQRFFERHQSVFDLRTNSVSRFLRENAATVFEGLSRPQQDQLATQLKRIGRVFQLSTGLSQMQALLELDLDSAYKIVTRASQNKFSELYSQALGGDANANSIYARALGVHNMVTAAMGGLADFHFGLAPNVLLASSSVDQKLTDNPDYADLFGSLDLCACEQCRSVYSPAAYLVDLLAFLDTPKNSKTPNPLDVLIGNESLSVTGRRPDIAQIQLTCDNTNTRIPYIDLIVEVLESYVAHDQPFAFNRPPDPPDDVLPSPSADELGANPVYLTQDSEQSAAKASDALRASVYPLTLPFNTELVTARIYLEHLSTPREELMRAFAIDDALDTLMATATETLGLSPQDFEIITLSQFLGASSTIVATLGEAYGFSEAPDLGADFPPHAAAPRLRINDPRKLQIKALQHYLNLAGAAPALQVNGLFDTTTQSALDAFQVAAGATPTGEADGGVWAKFDTTSDTPLGPLMSYVPIFLQRTGTTFPELIELLQSRFMNSGAFDIDLLKRLGFSQQEVFDWIKAGFPALTAAQMAKLAAASMPLDRFQRWAEAHRSVIVISAPAGSDCNLDATTIRHLDGSLLKRDELRRLNAFVRLWRRLGWPLGVLDRAYSVLFDDSFNFILRLADARRVMRELELDPEPAFSFWGAIDTRGERSPYDRLFRNKAALRIDPIFLLDETRSELKAVSDNPPSPPKIADHLPAILSALRIRASDLDLLIATVNVGKLLNLANLSQLYRYTLLAKSLSISIPALLTLQRLSAADPFNASTNPPLATFQFIQLVRKVQAGGSNPDLLDFIFRHHVSPPAQPERPTPVTLAFLEALRTGLARIEAEHRVLPDPAGELAHSELSILESDPAVVDETVHMLDGTVRYAQSLPDLPPNVAIPTEVRQKITYQAATGTLRFQGVMSPAEKSVLDGVAPTLPVAIQGHYLTAISALFDLPRAFFNNHLAVYFDVPATAAATLLDTPSLDFALRPAMLDSVGAAIPRDASGNLPPTPQVTASASASKFQFLLEALVRQTRQVLKHALVMQSAADALSIDTALAAAFLKNPDVLQSIRDPGQSAITDFLEIHGDGLAAAYYTSTELTGDAALFRTDPTVDFDWTTSAPDPVIPAGNFSVRWAGLIAVPYAGDYTFRIESADGVRLWVDGALIIDDWTDQPLTTRTGTFKLDASIFYSLRIEYYRKTTPSVVRLSWSTPASAPSIIPTDALFTAGAATLLTKASLIASGLRLNAKEIAHFSKAKLIEFNKLPLNSALAYDPTPFAQWLRLVDYAALRDAIPKGETDLIDVFSSPSAQEANRRLADATGWASSEIEELTGPNGFGFTAPDFTTEQRVRRLPTCFALMQRLGITMAQALRWASIRTHDTSVTPPVTIWAFTINDAPRAIQLAQDIRNIARAKHDDKNWIEIARPLSGALRDQRKKALLDYTLALPSIIQRNIFDSGNLFEFFLVDVDTSSCTETSRIKQAISSVQLFIHRCLMGLEDHGPLVPYTVLPGQIDAPRWNWMQREVLWEANQKVFRYPENWLKPELRDDRTPIFRELESELLQSDLTDPYVEKALVHYLEKLDDVARLEICGVREDPEAYSLHVFGRTRNTPHVYFHRTLTRKRGDTWNAGTWSAWEKVPLDIEGVDDGKNGELSGVHLLPVMWNRRLYALWPTFHKKTDTAANASLPQGFAPIEQWEIKLSWSEFLEGKWSSREVSDAALVGMPDTAEAISETHSKEYYAPNQGTITVTTTTTLFGIEVDKQSYTLPTVNPLTISGGELDGVHLETLADYAQAEIDDETFEMNQFLPPAADHLFAVRPGSDQLVIDTYQRYAATATGKRSNKRVVDTVAVQGGRRDARQKRTDDQTESYRPVENYRWIGRFTIDGCRNKVVSAPVNQPYAYNAFVRPKGTSNFFNSMLVDASQTRFEIDPSPVILATLPSRYTVLDSDPEPGFTDTSPFFYQDSQRVFLVVTSTAPPWRSFGVGSLGSLNALAPVITGTPAQQKPFNPKLDLGRPYALVASEAQVKANPWMVNFASALQTMSLRADVGDHTVAPATMTTMSGTITPPSAFATHAIGALTMNPVTMAAQEYRYLFLAHWHPFVCEFIRRLNRAGVSSLLATDSQLLTNDSFSVTTGTKLRFRTEYAPTPSVALPLPLENVDFNAGAYSLYNWELFFHAPLLIAQRLSKNQRFAEAQRWYHFIFNPLDNSTEASPARFWKFLPFKTTQPERLIEMLELLGYQGTDPTILQQKHDIENQVDQWAHDPFNPHRIARLRPVAYMKSVVMGYIDNLIAWGDYLFSQNTLESINEATHLYVIALSLLGARPQKIAAKTQETPKTFSQLRASLDALSNAHIEAETLFPFATNDVLMTPPAGAPQGIATTLFFCLPPNDQLSAYWDRIEDRLFKIRHCMNIEGVVRQLPLFDPPIDPALLVEAAARGVDLNSVLNDLYTPLPRYRFEYMLQKALEMCAEVRSFGAALLSALEKRDAETLAQLRTTHERALLDIVRNVKASQLAEAQANLESLQKTRAVTATRFMHYQGLLGYKADADFAPGSAAPMVSDRAGDNRLPEEVFQQERMQAANESQQQASMWDMLANGIHFAVPDFSIGTPSSSTTYGGSNIGAALTAMSRFLGNNAATATYEGNNAALEASFRRRDQMWVLESNVAAREIEQIDRQISAAEIRIAISQREIDAQDKQIEQAEEMREFLVERKFTQEELYFWMQNELATLHLQCYQIAYGSAKQAQRCYGFATGTDTTFVQFGAWDSLRKGLLSGERLYLQLKQMERSYLEQNRREYEIARHVSLATIDPAALIRLRETGECEVTVPETLFDLDFPGHYMRRLKSVALTIPCVVGPYTGVNCTLTLLRSEVRKNTVLSAGYRRIDEQDARFMLDILPTQSIATSQAQTDSGLFEVNFRDEHFLPFEGAGAISTWRIQLQNEFRQFDYDTIADVVLHLKYTARDGGALLSQAAVKALKDAIKNVDDQPILRLFSMRREYASEWYRFLDAPAPAADAQDPTLTVSLAKNRFPFALQARKITIESIRVFIKVRPEFTATHNEGTLQITLEQGVPTPSASPISLVPWNGLLYGELAPGGAAGDWTLTAWLTSAGAPRTRLAPGALEDVALICVCTAT